MVSREEDGECEGILNRAGFIRNAAFEGAGAGGLRVEPLMAWITGGESGRWPRVNGLDVARQIN